jgi:hypothetical protein
MYFPGYFNPGIVTRKLLRERGGAFEYDKRDFLSFVSIFSESAWC